MATTKAKMVRDLEMMERVLRSLAKDCADELARSDGNGWVGGHVAGRGSAYEFAAGSLAKILAGEDL